MQFIVRGLTGAASEHSLTQCLALYFRVKKVTMVRDGDAERPWAVVDVHDAYLKVWDVTRRLQGSLHLGGKLKFYIPLYQPHPLFCTGEMAA